jgi:hypothetical protein
LCILTITVAFVGYYGQIFQPSPILNTNMKFWTIDPTNNITRPYLWQVDIIPYPLGADNVSIYQFEVDNRQSLALRVVRTSVNSSSVWTTVHVRQDLHGQALAEIFRSQITLWVYPTFHYYYDSGSKNPQNTFGIEINDGTDLLWYVFADGPSQVFQLPHHRIVLTETPLDTWSLRGIDIAEQFREAGWKVPDSISFTLILGTTWLHPGNWVGYFSGLTVNVSPLQTESLSLSQRLALLIGDSVIIMGLVAVTVFMRRHSARRVFHRGVRSKVDDR